MKSPPAPSSPLTSPEGDNGSTQIHKDGIGIAGATAAVISTGIKGHSECMKLLPLLNKNNYIVLCYYYSKTPAENKLFC